MGSTPTGSTNKGGQNPPNASNMQPPVLCDGNGIKYMHIGEKLAYEVCKTAMANKCEEVGFEFIIRTNVYDMTDSTIAEFEKIGFVVSKSNYPYNKYYRIIPKQLAETFVSSTKG